MEAVAKIEKKRWWGSLNALPMNAGARHIKSHTHTLVLWPLYLSVAALRARTGQK